MVWQETMIQPAYLLLNWYIHPMVRPTRKQPPYLGIRQRAQESMEVNRGTKRPEKGMFIRFWHLFYMSARNPFLFRHEASIELIPVNGTAPNSTNLDITMSR